MNRTATVLTILAGLPVSLFAADPAPQGSGMFNLIPLIGIPLIFYFLVIRPQQKQAKQHQQMINTLKKDDKIQINGIFGTVVSVQGDVVQVKIADNVRIQVAKNSITRVTPVETESAAPVTPEVVK